MVRTLQLLLDILWPQDEPKVSTSAAVSVKKFTDIHYLLPYKQTTTQQIIKNNKYHAQSYAAKQLAYLLDQYCDTQTEDFVILPMPISNKRWRERGYNHIERILTYSRYKHTVRSDLLYKKVHTKQQTHVTKSDRVKQQVGTFASKQLKNLPLPHFVLLLDDVVTTGATMRAAKQAVQKELPPNTKIICLAIAH